MKKKLVPVMIEKSDRDRLHIWKVMQGLKTIPQAIKKLLDTITKGDR